MKSHTQKQEKTARRSGSDHDDPARVQRVGAEGMSGAPRPLPFLMEIQRSFGRHDVRAVRTYVGGAAAESARKIGALAYTVAQSIAFRADPDLRTAAHEAAHVVQQAAGLAPSGGVGRAGDRLEQHADEVAEAVVAGRSAEPLLDRLVARGAAPVAAVQRVETRYFFASDIRLWTLAEFERYAQEQADWVTSDDMSDQDREALFVLFQRVRAEDGLYLAALGPFLIGDLLDLPPGDWPRLRFYAEACLEARSGGGNTVAVRQPARTLAEALLWSEGLRALHSCLPGSTLNRIIPQRQGCERLRDLMGRNLTPLAMFVAYVNDIHPMFDADNGAEISSFLRFCEEGAGWNTLAGELPYLRNLHRFERRVLDHQRKLMHGAQSNLPLTVVLQSVFDHNGAFHREAGRLWAVVSREDRQTVIIEASCTLGHTAAVADQAAKKLSPDGHIDELILSGHGNTNVLQLAGSKASGNFDQRDQRPVRVNDRKTAKFFSKLVPLLKAGQTRLVLNGCLVSSHVLLTEIEGEDPEAVLRAFMKNPSLVKYVEQLVSVAGGIDVIGANGSTSDTTQLVNYRGVADIFDPADLAITGNKQRYLEEGREPVGVLRACLEVWAWSRQAQRTPDPWRQAIERRLAVEAKDWDGVVTNTLLGILLTVPDPALMRYLERAAHALSRLQLFGGCRPKDLVTCMPATCMEIVFKALSQLDSWYRPHVGLVFYQAWMVRDPSKRDDLFHWMQLLAEARKPVATLTPCVDFEIMNEALLPPRLQEPYPKGIIWLVLLLTQSRGGIPSPACRALLRELREAGGGRFPEGAHVNELSSSMESQLLETLYDDDHGNEKEQQADSSGANEKGKEKVPNKGELERRLEQRLQRDKSGEPNLPVGQREQNNLRVAPVALRAIAGAEIAYYQTPQATSQRAGQIEPGEQLYIIGVVEPSALFHIFGRAVMETRWYAVSFVQHFAARRLGRPHVVFIPQNAAGLRILNGPDREAEEESPPSPRVEEKEKVRDHGNQHQ